MARGRKFMAATIPVRARGGTHDRALPPHGVACTRSTSRARGNHYPVSCHAAESTALREGDRITIGGRSWAVMIVLGHVRSTVTLVRGGELLISAINCGRRSTKVSVGDRPYDDPLRSLPRLAFARFRPLRPMRRARARLAFAGSTSGSTRARDHDERLAETLDALGEAAQRR